MPKLRESARGRECQVRIPGICNRDPETVILAHLGGAGMGRKSPDLHAAFACYACHEAIDGRIQTEYSNAELELMHLQGMVRTQIIWIEEGVI